MKSKKPVGFWEAFLTGFSYFSYLLIGYLFFAGIVPVAFGYGVMADPRIVAMTTVLAVVLAPFIGGWRPFARRDKR